MAYYGDDQQLADFLHQAKRAVRESPAAHWKRPAVRAAAAELGHAIHERYHSIDPEPDPIRTHNR